MAFEDAPDHPVGLPFADADVTDESFAERTAQETPELEDHPEQQVRMVEPEILVDSALVVVVRVFRPDERLQFGRGERKHSDSDENAAAAQPRVGGPALVSAIPRSIALSLTQTS